jgi:hypothetical protein
VFAISVLVEKARKFRKSLETVSKMALTNAGAEIDIEPGDLYELADGKVIAAAENEEWRVGVLYTEGAICTYNGQAYEVIMRHLSQYSWTPEDAPSLFKKVNLTGEIQEWIQPTGSHDAYNLGDKVTHNEATYISTVASNTWEPGVYGWEVV